MPGDSAIRRQADVIILGVKPTEGPLVFNSGHETLIRASDTSVPSPAALAKLDWVFVQIGGHLGSIGIE